MTQAGLLAILPSSLEPVSNCCAPTYSRSGLCRAWPPLPDPPEPVPPYR